MKAHIAILEPQVAAKIAAGEVIERPSAVVRELLDNAIDAGATEISLYLEEGGLQLIRVSDNGLGMGREDLERCYLSHATSKIRKAEDLLQLGSLGFRGEALGSIAACSKLRIISAQEIFTEIITESAQEKILALSPKTPSKISAARVAELPENKLLRAYELRVADSLFQSLQETSAASSGTQIEVRDLFYSFPARRKFLKSARSELGSCKAIFWEKALAFPHIHFRLYNGGRIEISLAPSSALERICQIYKDLVPEQLFLLQAHGTDFSLQFFAAPPAIYRRDRKRMPLYINQRPIVDSTLQQAVRLGFDSYLAGGLFPVCLCFIEVAPERVDFNIHPAKREARLRDLRELQGCIRQTLRNFCDSGSTSERPPVSPQFSRLGANQTGGGNDTLSSSDLKPDKDFYANSHRKFRAQESPTIAEHPADYMLAKTTNKDTSSGDFHSSIGSSWGRQSFSARDLASRESLDNFANLKRKQRAQNGNFHTDIDLSKSPSPHASLLGKVGSSAAQFLNEEDSLPEFRYLGQLFEVFLLVQKDIAGVSSLLIVDQHASHERILYETLEQEMLQQQPLLVPIEFEVEASAAEWLRQRSGAFAKIGIRLEEVPAREEGGTPNDSLDNLGSWRITSLPPSVSDLKEELIELILHGGSEAEDLKRELFAHLSCRKAIKKGDLLDDLSATQLLRDLFAKGLERCPHGRPLWYSLSKPELCRLLQRT